MATRKTSLTAKRLAFCREYVKDCNATQAAIRAGFSPNGARFVACKLLRDSLVEAEILRRVKPLTVKADVTTDRVLRELARIGFSDLTSMVCTETGHIAGARVVLRPTDALTTDQRAAISEIVETENGIRVKLHDKTKALELLGKYLALFTDRTEVTGTEGGPLVVVQPPVPK